MTDEHLVPVRPEERVESVDVIRGFSLLGILLLNIVAFGLPFAAYFNPSIYGGDTGSNLWTWLTAQTLFDGKMRCIFSMLFGTSGLLLLERAERRGAGIEAADIYYRRILWLIAIGMFHGYFIWMGDILYSYGVVGLLLFPLRKLSARALIIAGTVVVVLHSAQGLAAGFAMRELAPKAAEVERVERTGAKLTDEQVKTKTEWAQMSDLFQPKREKVQEEIKTHRGGWVENFKLRAGEAALFEFTLFFQFIFLDVLGMLLLGMGLWKAGVFNASRSYRFYAILTLAGFGIGVPLNFWAAKKWADGGFTLPDNLTYIGSTADPGRFLVAGAYIGILMILFKSGALRFVTRALAAVGRTALSNYLLTSILCTLFFNGYGLGMYAKLERLQLYAVVLGMWTINLIASSIWLRYFLYGPAEWGWRSLTYWQRQPIRRREEIAEAPADQPATA